MRPHTINRAQQIRTRMRILRQAPTNQTQTLPVFLQLVKRIHIQAIRRILRILVNPFMVLTQVN